MKHLIELIACIFAITCWVVALNVAYVTLFKPLAFSNWVRLLVP